MKQFRRCISFLLTLCLILPMLPQPVRAAEETQIMEDTVPETMVEITKETTAPVETTMAVEETMEESIPETTAAVEESFPEALIPQISDEKIQPQSEVFDSGTCGVNVTWEIDRSGNLTIRGTGPMSNYTSLYGSVPWYTNVYTVTIEEGVTSIGDYAFDGFYHDNIRWLKSVKIADSVTSIGKYAFSGCSKLTSIELPDSITSIGWNAFSSTGLSSIALPENLTSLPINAFQSCTSLSSVEMPFGLTSIEGCVFSNCSSLETIDIPASVRNIGEQVFGNCSLLKQIIIPDGITEILYKSFYGCSSLSAIVIPESVSNIGGDVFAGCGNLKDVYFKGTESQWNSITIGKNNGPLTDGTVTIHYNYTGTGIPKEYENGICGDNLLWQLNTRTGVLTISGTGEMYDYVRTSDIPWNDFHNAITAVEIEKGASSISGYAFANCFNLTSVAIPSSITSIGEGAFSGCMKLAEVKLPENVILGNAAFRNCAAMSKLELPAGCSLGEDAFAGCSGLKSITIPATVQSISKGAFSECESLESVVIEEGITQIEAEMFAQCEALATITIPASVRSIGDGAFFECNQLQEIFYGSTQWQWESIQKNIGKNNERLTSVTNIHFTDEDRLVVFADHTNLCIRKGGTITLGSAVIKDKKHMKDVSGIVLLVNDPSILRVTGQTEENGFLYVTLSAQKEGTTVISFQDSITGFSSKVAVTVFTDNYHSYTLNGVPEQAFAGEVNNFYNYNGLYIDNYTAVVQDDGSATVSFDVYNRNQSSGVVEVYQADGKIYNGVLIEKQQDYNSSIKETMLDGPVGLIKDLYNGDLLTYRQSTNYTKHTHVEVEIPKDGYIRITNDPEASDIVAAVNILDVLMSIKEIAGDIKGYSKKSADFAKELTAELVKAKAKEVFGKDDFKFAKSMMKSVTKDIFFSSEALGDFAETVTKNLEEVNLGETLWNCTKKFGWGVGESTLLYFTGPCKAILTGLFTVSDIMNSLYQCLDLKRSIGVGFIEIQNQGGGIRHAKEVAVESENGFDDDVALNVFRVESHNHPKSLEYLQKYYPHLYESAKNSGEIYTYNISLQQGGKEVQPDGKVTVYIRIQNENMMISAAAGMVMIFREEKDGTLTEMDYKVENDCFVFTTDHFSLYTIRSFGEVGVTRLAGAARVDTAIEIAEQTKKELGIQKFQAMIYTVGKNFADALAGTSLAAQKKAPILLYSAKRDAYVRQYIQDNLAQGGTVYYLGGSDVMPEESAQALRSAGINVKRLEGKTRFQTNLAILQETGLKGGEILVCTSHSFADSLSASATGMPILLVRDTWTTLHKDVVDCLKTLTQPCTFHIIGGTAAVPAHLEEELKAYGTVDRIYGNTRYLTSVEVAKRFFHEADRAVLAVGSDFPDGLCGGPLAYAMGAPLILTKTGKESAAMAYTTGKGIHSGAVLGSNAENLVTDASAAKIFGVDVDQIGSK